MAMATRPKPTINFKVQLQGGEEGLGFGFSESLGSEVTFLFFELWVLILGAVLKKV